MDIRPHFPSKMTDASAFYDSNFGRIEAAWVRKEDTIRLKLTIPEAIHGTLALESGYQLKNGSTACPAVSGEYVIRKA